MYAANFANPAIVEAKFCKQATQLITSSTRELINKRAFLKTS